MLKCDNQVEALVLQGGGALGAYQAGAICQLLEEGVVPRNVAGISIGAINAAIYAGNQPENRADRLSAFWNRVASATMWPGTSGFGATISATLGVPGFFAPRFPPASIALDGPAAASFYDTGPLRRTLEELVDFDVLNAGQVRLVVGAVDVATGNFVWFDNAEQRITPEHILASGALPPGFAPVKIGAHYYWDGGLVSNTPLARVIETRSAEAPLTVWQIDLFPARGHVPRTIWEVEARDKDIRYSSRTRAITDQMALDCELAAALHAYKDELPDGLRHCPAIARILDTPSPAPLTLMHLIYRSNKRESGAKDYDFSHDAMTAHWVAGRKDVARSLSHPRFVAHDAGASGVHIFDLANDHGTGK